MIWIDKLAVAWALTLWVILLQLARNDMSIGALNPEILKLIMLLAGGPWLILRGIHLGWLMMLRPR